LDAEAMYGAQAYRVEQLLTDVRTGVWKELSDKSPAVDICRRELQRGYLTTLDGKINNGIAGGSEVRALARHELRTLAKQIDAALPRATDRVTKLHLAESRKDIERILNGKTSTAGGGGGGSFIFFGLDNSGHGCFSRGDALRMLELDGMPAEKH
jgi:hypothetical protein